LILRCCVFGDLCLMCLMTVSEDTAFDAFAVFDGKLMRLMCLLALYSMLLGLMIVLVAFCAARWVIAIDVRDVFTVIPTFFKRCST